LQYFQTVVVDPTESAPALTASASTAAARIALRNDAAN
jgi:hypothetical protein